MCTHRTPAIRSLTVYVPSMVIAPEGCVDQGTIAPWDHLSLLIALVACTVRHQDWQSQLVSEIWAGILNG